MTGLDFTACALSTAGLAGALFALVGALTGAATSRPAVAGVRLAPAGLAWRGLAAGVIENTLAAVCKQACVNPERVRVWLGPCIGPEAFEVGEDVRAAFTSHTALESAQAHSFFKPHAEHAGKWLADLAGLARLRLRALGVNSVAGNDSTTEWCTVHQDSKLFSFRRDGVTGRFAVCIWRN